MDDHRAITDVLHRYARGIDRLDAAMVRACYHDDARDSRPPLFDGDADAFVAWVFPSLRAMIGTTHFISNILIEQDGDRAGAESYFHAVLRTRSDGRLIEAARGGRYIDRFERRGGQWRIAERRAVIDWTRTTALADEADSFAAFVVDQSARPPHIIARDRTDISYEVLAAPAD